MTQLDIKVVFERIEEVTQNLLLNVLSFAVLSFYGQVGGSKLQYKILEVDPGTQRVLMEAPEEDARKIWCSLTMLGYYASSRVKVLVTVN